jgi:peptidoglycan-associated lipoprotein
MYKHLIGLALLGLLAACASDKSKETSSGASTLTRAPIDNRSASDSSAADTNNVTTHNLESATGQMGSDGAMGGPDGALTKRSVYFAFDASAVQESDIPVVQANAKYLADHPDQKVRVEGNADERGSNEYNLALGQRRADSVQKMLELGGVSANQISTVSYGEEKPVATGHNEAAWAQNRRADLNYR